MEERNPFTIIIGALTLLLLVFFAWMLSSGKIGLLASQLEASARKTQQVDSSWHTLKSEAGPLTAFLFYNEDRDDYTYAVYQNPPGFSFGHFLLSEDGTASAIKDSVLMVATPAVEEGYTILLSMNTPEVAQVEVTRMEASSGDPVTVTPVDPAEPFALVLPAGVGDQISLYDAEGQSIPSVVLVLADSNAA
jgi:hypothetical protein